MATDDVLMPELKNSFKKSIKKAFYFIFQQIEELRNTDVLEKRLIQQNEIIEISENGIGPLLEELIHSYPTMQELFCETFSTPLCEASTVPLLMAHRHDDFGEPLTPRGEKEHCNCSFVELLMRYSSYLAPNNGGPYSRLLILLNSIIWFKRLMSLKFIQYYRFLFKTEAVAVKVNGLQSVQNQFLNTYLYSNLVYTQADWRLWFKAIKSVINICREKLSTTDDNGRDAFNEIYTTLFEWFSTRGFSLQVMGDPEVMKLYFEIVSEVQQTRPIFYSRQEVTADISLLDLQRRESDTIYSIYYEMYLHNRHMRVLMGFLDLPGKEVESAVLGLMRSLVSQILLVPETKTSTVDRTLERLFVIHAVFYLHVSFLGKVGDQSKVQIVDFEIKRLQQMSSALFSLPEEARVFWTALGSRLALTSGFVREVARGLWVGYV